MTDKQIIIDEVKCPWFNDGSCDLFYSDKEECWYRKCKDTPNCYYRETQTQLKRKEQECEGLKEEIKKHNDDMFKNPPEKRFYCKGCTLPYISKKLKQTLTEIREMLKEICMEECLFDWNKINKKHCGDCDCRYGQILQKISECEGKDETN